ncbi:hypothetical protein AAIB33_02825 [Microbacterium sp. AZCO]|uniref:hypothetical protein n=1 Tax=Microbacterium sp. AZCO TaxID=3142976 RepID=UPI0031F417DC
MTSRARPLAAAVALLALAALTACAPATGDPTPSRLTTPKQASPPTAVSPGAVSPGAVPTGSVPTGSPSKAPPPARDAPLGAVSPGGIEPVELAMPFQSALAAIGATPAAGCAWVGTATAGGYTMTVQREEPGDDASPVVLVSASVPADQVTTVGPTTTEGIGIGSTVADVRAAYTNVEDIASTGDRRYLKALAVGDAALFFTYTAGQDVVWAVTSTLLPEPPYEACG